MQDVVLLLRHLRCRMLSVSCSYPFRRLRLLLQMSRMDANTLFVKCRIFCEEIVSARSLLCVIHLTVFLTLALSVHPFEKPEECQLTYISGSHPWRDFTSGSFQGRPKGYAPTIHEYRVERVR